MKAREFGRALRELMFNSELLNFLYQAIDNGSSEDFLSRKDELKDSDVCIIAQKVT
jgi:hypothetical protein